MKKLVKGIIDFRQNLLSDYREKFSHLKGGQFPDALFVACSDSRVMPNLFASTNPGDLFVIRNVGNLVPPHHSQAKNFSVAAGIEYALTQLPVKDIVICGHSECGAMQAKLTGIEKISEPSLKTWLENIADLVAAENNLAYKNIIENEKLSPQNRLSQINVLSQIEHLKTYPIIREKIKDHDVHLHGWYFDIGTGDIYAFEKETGCFVLIDEEEGAKILARLED